MSYDSWALRVSVALGVLVGAFTTVRGFLRVLRGTFRVFDTILGVGKPGDADYRPSVAARLDEQADAIQALRDEVAAARAEVASTHLVAVEAIVTPPSA